ncbi:MAG: cardiolipin synthase [Bacteroidaceae bacterium]|nr:cardiolipin synthase [Bacteroidaceae bacterium]
MKRFPWTLLLLLCLPLLAAKSRANEDWTEKIKKEGAVFSGNNSIVFFKTGEEKFQDLFAAVEQAQSSVHMEYFNFRDDSIANKLFDLLVRKVHEGVEVRLLYDAFGNSSNNRPIKKKKLKELRNRGLNIHEFDPIRFPWLNHALNRDHRKIVIIDGKSAYSGGMNVADYYIKGKPEFGEWRDMHFRVEGDVVAEYQKIFLRIWERTTGENVSGTQYYPGESLPENALKDLKRDTTATARSKQLAVVNREPHTATTVVRHTFEEAIKHAQRKIQIINPYFTLRHKVREALKDALRRGVLVEIMVSEKCDIPITPRIVDYNVRKLQRRGAEVYYFQGGFHHSKIMMVDDEFSYVGSANLDSRSLYFDYECNLLILDRNSTHELQRIFDYDKMNRCVRLDDTYWKKKSKGQKFSAWFYHFLQPFV